MGSPKKTFALFVKAEAKAQRTADQFVAEAQARGHTVIDQSNLQTEDKDALKDIDCVISIGGDGTLLHAGQLALSRDIPIAGINNGALGFLAEFDPGNPEILFEQFHKPKIRTIPALKVTTKEHGSSIALNDAVINKNALSRMLELEIQIGDGETYNLRADGVILSTPAGSTAYNLSAGGPVIFPGLDAWAITPICAQGVGNRTIVVPADTPITVNVYSQDAFLTIDGQAGYELAPTSSVEISLARPQLQLIRNPKRTFVGELRSKLHWGNPNLKK